MDVIYSCDKVKNKCIELTLNFLHSISKQYQQSKYAAIDLNTYYYTIIFQYNSKVIKVVL